MAHRPHAIQRIAWALTALLVVAAGPALGQADPLINEFVFNHTGTDNFEYVEVKGDPATDYSAFTVLEIEGDGSGAGVIDGVFDVGTTNGAGYWTTDFLSNVIENGTVTLLLVENFTGAQGDDVDTDNDGNLDVAPWGRLVDSIAVTDGDSGDGSYGVLLAPGFDGATFTVGGASRIPDGTDSDSDSDWVRNDFDGAGIPGLDPGTPDPGEAENTPDAQNSLVGGAPTDPLINEFVFNHTGTDNFEYVEVAGDAGTDYSAYTVLEIEGDSGASLGVVDGVFDVGTTNGAGYWTTGFRSNDIENGTVTLLLVEGWTGAQGDDLDTDDDGNIDVAPWSRVVDSVAVTDGGGSDLAYGTVVLTPSFDGVGFTVGGASRIPDGIDTDAASDWTRNDFDGEGIPGLEPGTPEPGEAFNTPEAENQAVPAEPVAGWILNEIHADPDASAGDANGDGTVNTSQDEFLEVVNTTGGDVDVSGWTISDAVGVRHVFPAGTTVLDGCGFVVFAGGNPEGGFGGMVVQTSSTGQLGFNNGGDTITLADGVGTEVASQTYGGEGGDNQSLTRDPDLSGGFVQHSGATGSGGALFSPGTRVDGTVFDGCPEVVVQVLEIYEIQGSGVASPVAGQTVRSEDNVVTAVAPDGFYLQTPAERADGDAATSDGIFVFTDDPPLVSVGDRVTVEGQVVEFFDLTEFSRPTEVLVLAPGVFVPTPIVLDANTPSEVPMVIPDLEPYEGMIVAFEGGAVTGPTDRFGDTSVTADGERAYREPGILFPGLTGLPVWDGNPEVFEIDPDGLGGANLLLDAGQEILLAQGPLTFSFGDYQIEIAELVLGAPPVLPEPVRTREVGEATIGSLNLFRLFDTVDDPGSEDNGAVTDPVEYATRLNKFSLYIRNVLRSPDVLGVQEVENLNALQDLAAKIAADDPSVQYTAYLVEGNDVGGIDVGFLVRDNVTVNSLTQLGATETLSVDGSLLHDRPPLVLDAEIVTTRAAFPVTVMVLHNRSLGGIEDPADGPRVRQKRLEQAQSVAEKVQAIQDTGARLVVVGDFNAYQFTDGYVDVTGQIQGDFEPSDNLLSGPDLVDPDLVNLVELLPADEQYSFIFDGSAQVLDHALVNLAVAEFVTGFGYGRGNADAADGRIDDPATPLRSSDHDGLAAFFQAGPGDADGDGVLDDVDFCADTVTPESVPTVSLGNNRYALVDGDGVFDSGKTGAPTFTLDDTAGCSCEQIIEIRGLGEGHRKFGCSLGEMREFVEMVN
jgi:endonuclease/exonuclease/phosphatase family metal-dependent hydrolase